MRLQPKALPELAWSDLDLSRSFLGKRFSLPFMITGMTGGVDAATMINRRLARAASEAGVPMGLGSQRIALEDPSVAGIFNVRREFPDVFIIANLGIGQLDGLGDLDKCKRVLDMAEANALAIHVNVLQELVQDEGDRDFRNVLDRIAKICAAIDRPVIVKEVGCGFDVESAMALFNRGVAAIDVGGKGGTSWSHIEGLRSQQADTRELGRVFRDWGIPTAESLITLRKQIPNHEISATGGMRDGLMAAKAIGVGATLVGFGLPLFRAAVAEEEGPRDLLQAYARQLGTAMLCSGCSNLSGLPARTQVERSAPWRV